MFHKVNCLAIVFAFALSASPLLAKDFDWPQWRGPNRDNLTEETGLLKEWPEAGPPVKWMSREIGLGYAGPAIVDGKLLILGSLEGTTYLFAINTQSGDQLWRTELSEDFKNGWGDGPRCTPTVDGENVYALSGTGTLVCVKLANGDEVWRTTMQDLGGQVPVWGYSESVLIDGDKLICTPGNTQGAIAALDKNTGELLWQTEELTDVAHYSSVIKADPAGREQYVQLLEKQVVGIDPENGDVLWQQDWPGRVAVIPTPLYHEGHIYISTGYGVGCRLIDLGETGVDPTTVYDNKTMKNKHDGLVLLGDYLYGYSDGGGWTCQNVMTGKREWSEKGKLGKGAIAYADGMLYCISEKEGEVVLIDATPEGWSEHGRFTLTPQTEQRSPKGGIWMHPVIVNGKLYLRDQELLFCFDIEKK